MSALDYYVEEIEDKLRLDSDSLEYIRYIICCAILDSELDKTLVEEAGDFAENWKD